jgi:hypothetical protein
VITPLIASAVAAPVPATDGKVQLAYELQLVKVLDEEVRLTSVDVCTAERTLLSMAGDRLANWTRIMGNLTPTTKLGYPRFGNTDGPHLHFHVMSTCGPTGFTPRDESAVSPLVLDVMSHAGR